MQLTPDLERRIRIWILGGESDERIARITLLSVKVIRAIRRDVEAATRPRGGRA